MDQVIPKIRLELQGLSQIRRRRDVYVTPFDNWWPTGTSVPSIGLLPGPVLRKELAGKMLEFTITVKLVGQVKLDGDGEDALCGETGVYQLLNAATDRLKTNNLGLTGFQAVRIGNDRPSNLVIPDTKIFLAKVVRDVIYTIERPR